MDVRDKNIKCATKTEAFSLDVLHSGKNSRTKDARQKRKDFVIGLFLSAVDFSNLHKEAS